jgi:DNA primase
VSLSPQFLDELRARTSLSGLVGRTVKLQKVGREWKACCPFHNEKTASFYVNDDKAFWHCFGCGVHGDAIRWLTDARGLPFMDAVKELAEAAGMEMPAPDPRAQEKAELAAGLHGVMAAAQKWFEQQLAGSEGAEARRYLDKREIAEATRARFGFGFAPDGRAKLRAALASFGDAMLIEAGLLISPDDQREPYDRFRGRLTFPIRDRRGRVIAFSGRIIGKGEPKYLNSPDTPLFDKGRTLFNIDKAAEASRRAGRVVVVEGQMDVISLDQAGISEVVAPLGTALTESQLELLWRLSEEPILCFDGDAAGAKAAVRAAVRALPHVGPNRSLRFVSLPAGKDPDDLVRSGGPAFLLGRFGQAESLADRIWGAELEGAQIATPEGRAGLKKRLHELAASIHDPLVREQYRTTFDDKFWKDFGWRRREIGATAREISGSRKPKPADFMYSVLRAVLFGLSRYPDVLVDNLEVASQLIFPEKKLRGWFDILSAAVLERPNLDEDLIDEILNSSDVAPTQKRDITKDLAFSFFRRHEPARGRLDLREVISTLVAEQELAKALTEADEKLKARTHSPEWEQQQRLLAARHEVRARLSRMAEAVSAKEGSASDAGTLSIEHNIQNTRRA